MVSNDDSIQANITGFWAAVAPGYEAHGGNVPAKDSAELEAWVRVVRRVLPSAPSDVLDLGTGTGFIALIAAQCGHRVTAVDLAEPMLMEARKAATEKGLRVRFECRDAVAPGFEPQSFDAVICRHVLWTLREPELALRHWRALLRPGGRVIAIDGFWFREESPNEFFDRYYDTETRAALPAMNAESAERVAGLFEQAGFQGTEVSSLNEVHQLAETPPSPEPWYLILAHTRNSSKAT